MLKKILGMLFLFVSLNAHSAEVTLNEAAIEAIFSQDGFGTNSIDIRYGEMEVLEAGDLLELDRNTSGSTPEFEQLVARSSADPTSIYMYFIDRFVNADGSASGAVGLANVNTIAIVSDTAKGATGAIVQAHEIGHLLGLRHCGDFLPMELIDLCAATGDIENLMDEGAPDPLTPYSGYLNQGQIDRLLASPLVPLIKNDSGGNYITVTPVLVRAPAPDADEDGVEDSVDNCVATANPFQVNSDGDSAGDACDICPLDENNDADGDGICGEVDNCPAVANGDQSDVDNDGFGDACNTGFDNDGDEWANHLDNCPAAANPEQDNQDGDVLGDACDACILDPNNDADGDGVCGDVDNCPTLANADQRNTDGAELGNACDLDDDGDSVDDTVDNCPLDGNASQLDDDQDGLGNACDLDKDNDNIADDGDQCPNSAIGAVVDDSGCAIAQYCPQNGNWKNHGAYVRCVVKTSKRFVTDGFISQNAAADTVSTAASSKNGN